MTFFERMNPDSTRPKPACMNNTRIPAISSHAMSIADVRSSIASPTSWALANPVPAANAAIAPTAAAMTVRWRILIDAPFLPRKVGARRFVAVSLL